MGKIEEKVVLAGNLEHGNETLQVYIIEDKNIVRLSPEAPDGFVKLGHISDYTNRVRDMFSVVNLWKLYGDNFNAKNNKKIRR